VGDNHARVGNDWGAEGNSMKHDDKEPFDVSRFKSNPDDETSGHQRKSRQPKKRQRQRRQHGQPGQYVKLPLIWIERLKDANATTCHLAHHLLLLRWKAWSKSAAILLPNDGLKEDGINRRAKWRALRDLEQRGLITIECQAKRSPLIGLRHIPLR
jgi:hypothetical protein